MKKIVHVVGTGTIGEPLLGLFTDFRDRMGIDEVTFHKRTPLASDRAKLNHLIRRGAKWSGLDLTSESVERVGARLSTRNLAHDDLRQGSALEIPWPRKVPAYRSLPAPLSRNHAAPSSMTASQP